jgi:hypothetical protein
MFEHKSEPLLTRWQFVARLGKHFAASLVIVSGSLLIGSAGYHYFGHLPWLDALLNAAMILTGMGPVDRMENPAGKFFATFYALYSGIAFLSIVAVLVAPVIHRVIHKLHIDVDED